MFGFHRKIKTRDINDRAENNDARKRIPRVSEGK